MSSQRLRRRGRPKAPNIPLSFDSSASSSPYPSPHEVARLANIMTSILAVRDNIIQKDKVYPICLLTTTRLSLINRFNFRKEILVCLLPH